MPFARSLPASSHLASMSEVFARHSGAALQACPEHTTMVTPPHKS